MGGQGEKPIEWRAGSRMRRGRFDGFFPLRFLKDAAYGDDAMKAYDGGLNLPLIRPAGHLLADSLAPLLPGQGKGEGRKSSEARKLTWCRELCGAMKACARVAVLAGALAAAATFAAGGQALAQAANDAAISAPAAEISPAPTSGQAGAEYAGPSGPVDATSAAAPAPSTMSPAASAGRAEPQSPQGAVPGTELPHDLSPWGMFMAADWVVKSVMLGLAFASLVTWTVWLAKSLEIAGARRRLRAVLRTLGGARTLGEAVGGIDPRGGPGAMLAAAAAEEVRLSAEALEHNSADGLKERVASRLGRIHAQAGRRLARGTGVLATIGSTAPFVGLFGTVWGIMNSFIGISEAQTTNLAVVAPGIAEALLATALGLVAAIPAVVIYNMFARAIASYRQALADAAAAVERLVSRDLDHRFVTAGTYVGADRERSALIRAAAE